MDVSMWASYTAQYCASSIQSLAAMRLALSYTARVARLGSRFKPSAFCFATQRLQHIHYMTLSVLALALCVIDTSTQSSTPVGGDGKPQIIGHSTIRDHLINPVDASDVERRYRFVDHIPPDEVEKYQAEEFVILKPHVAELSRMLTLTASRGIAKTHGMHIKARATGKEMRDIMASHHCSKCETHVTVFIKLLSEKELNKNRVNSHRSSKKASPPSFSTCDAVNDEIFPPHPVDNCTRDQVINSACKRMSPSSFEESGCAVCGELHPISKLSKLKHVKKHLDILCASGVTRCERESESDATKEHAGPVIDHSCDNICDTCRRFVREGKVPKLALCNGLWIGEVPKQLKRLRFAERLLVARVRHTCAYVKVASGMRKMKANVIAFENPLPKVYKKLPPPREDLDDVLAILFTGPCKPTAEDFKRTPLLIRRNVVLEALKWLKANHIGYFDIEICAEYLEQYPEDEPYVSVEYRVSDSNKVSEGTSVFDNEGEDGTEEGPCPFTVHGLTAETLNNMLPSQIKAAALRHFNNLGGVLAIGHSATIQSIYNNPHLYPQMFPWLFPYGLGGIGSTTRGAISETEHKRHLLMYHDKRFQTDDAFPFVAFCHEQIKANNTSAFLQTKKDKFKDITDRLMTVNWTVLDEMTQKMEAGDTISASTVSTPDELQCFQVINDLDAVSGMMHGSLISKKHMRNEIWSMVAALGAPYWYITLSPADNRHPLCIYLANTDTKFNPIPLSNSERTRLICQNPVAAARFFHFMVQSFITDILGYKANHRGLYGEVNGYYGTVEQQGRLTLHLHLLLWIKGTPTPQEVRDRLKSDKTSQWADRLVKWLDSCSIGEFITGTHEEVASMVSRKEKEEGYRDPSLTLPVPPPAVCKKHKYESLPQHGETSNTCNACSAYQQWEKIYFETVDEILLGANVHDCTRGYTKDGKRKKNATAPGCMDNKWGKCKGRFPRAIVEETHIDDTGVVVLKKKEKWLNTITPPFTYLTRTNTDVTSLASGTAIKAVIMYVSDYITKTSLKTHTIFDTVRGTFRKHGEMLNGTSGMQDKARAFMTKVVNQLSAKAELGAPMICMYLLKNPDHYTSHEYVTFYWRTYVAEARRPFEDDQQRAETEEKVLILRSRGKVVACSWIQDYIHRPIELSNINLYEYIRCYKRVSILAGKNKESQEADDIHFDTFGEALESTNIADHDASSGSDNDSEADVDEQNVDKGSGARIKRMDKYTYRFAAEHAQYLSHGMRYIKDNQLRLLNFIGSLPRSDKGDIEYYCSTMLSLFKPWRTGHDLRTPNDNSWKDAFERHEFTGHERRLMINFNIKFECMDARDDYRAQLKKGASPTIIGSWDATADEGLELPESDAYPSASHYDSLDSNDALLKEGKQYRKKLNNIRDATSTMNNLGWSISKGAGYAATPDFVEPCIKQGSSQWQDAVEQCKQAVLDKKKENIDGPNIRPVESMKKTSDLTQDPNSRCFSFLPNRVRIIDKSYFSKTFQAPGPLMTPLVNSSIDLFTLNEEQERSFRIIANHALAYDHDQLNMYIGGMGGTGKSQVLKALSHFFAERGEAHRFIVVAPTGSAAALLGGGTYHSVFGINKFSETQPGVIKARLKGVDYVFFDEVSMLCAMDLHRIDVQLKKIRDDQSSKPFGGLNMIFCGDFAQLPPAIGGENKSLYSRTIGMHSTDPQSQSEAMGKSLWHQVTTAVILRQNMRQRGQSAEDSRLRTALDNMRYKACTQEDISFLLTRVSCNIDGMPSVCDDRFRNEAIITGTNLVKDVINKIGSERFADETGQSLIDFYSDDSERIRVQEPGNTRKHSKIKLQAISDNVQTTLWDQAPSFTDKHIAGKVSLCIGLPVMIRYNYATELCMTRGQEGYVVSWQSKKGSKGQNCLDVVFVKLKSPPSDVKIEGLPMNVVPIYPRSNVLTTMLPNGDKILVLREQVELLPNFAMTAYASQGKTRPNNPVHLLGLDTHQAYYTALSRSSSAEGTVIINGFDVRVITGGCSGALRQEFRELELLDSITKAKHEGKLPDDIIGDTRNILIKKFRNWKGMSFVPDKMHKSIRWSKKDPYLSIEDTPSASSDSRDLASRKQSAPKLTGMSPVEKEELLILGSIETSSSTELQHGNLNQMNSRAIEASALLPVPERSIITHPNASVQSSSKHDGLNNKRKLDISDLEFDKVLNSQEIREIRPTKKIKLDADPEQPYSLQSSEISSVTEYFFTQRDEQMLCQLAKRSRHHLTHIYLNLSEYDQDNAPTPTATDFAGVLTALEGDNVLSSLDISVFHWSEEDRDWYHPLWQKLSDTLASKPAFPHFSRASFSFRAETFGQGPGWLLEELNADDYKTILRGPLGALLAREDIQVHLEVEFGVHG
ncbi:hypothetical protein CVT24_004165 [Panaeolus cyanescens]|uniref:ATP-dependent DNA helicase n=1 Tax=Panaeolus cyanescens TaxID=181874 RepID=A0A409YX85_9AGAR|nr:hypothetical protein CVT24_004165 [Panaeolus cyanescens]